LSKDFNAMPRAQFCFIGLLGLWLAASVGCGSQSQDIESKSKRLVQDSDDMIAVLRSIRDPASADAAIPQLKDGYSRLADSIRAFFGTVQKLEGTQVSSSVKKAADEGLAAVTKSMSQAEAETRRIESLRGLSLEFWNALRLESNAMTKVIIDMLPAGAPVQVGESLRGIADALERFGPARVVQLEFTGAAEPRVREIAGQLTSKVGTSGKVIHLGAGPKQMVMVAPIEDFDQFRQSIDFGAIVSVEVSQRKIVVNPNVRQPTTVASANRGGGRSGPQQIVGGLRDNWPTSEPADQLQATELTEQPPTPRPTPPPRPTLPDRSDPEYFRKLADLMLDDKAGFVRDEALDVLSGTRPSDIADKDTRQLIARNYRDLALDDRFGRHGERAIRGLVIYGGRFCAPFLIEILDKESGRVEPLVFEALAAIKDPKGAEAVAKHLDNIFNREEAARALANMGSIAEDALIGIAPSNDAEVSLAAVRLLGEVGTEKSLPLLREAQRSRNQAVKLAATASLRKIVDRRDTGEPLAADAAVDLVEKFVRGRGQALGNFGAPETNDRGNESSAAPLASVESLPKGDWSGVTSLAGSNPTAAGMPADPDARTFDDATRPQLVVLGAKQSEHERPIVFAVGGLDSSIAVVGHVDPFAKVKTSRLEFVDLKARKPVSSQVVLGSISKLYLSPQATRLLAVSDEREGDRRSALYVFDLTGEQPQELTKWWPNAGDRRDRGDISWADWIDEQSLLSRSDNGQLVMWRVAGATPTAVYETVLEHSARALLRRTANALLSPGRSYVLLASATSTDIRRAQDGALVATLQTSRPIFGAMAFDSAGVRLAAAARSHVDVWNMTTGTLEREFDCKSLRFSDSIAWLDDNHLLVNGEDIVDVQRRLVAWRYQYWGSQLVSHGPWQWMLVENRDTHALMPGKLLQDNVLAAAKDLDPDAILALRPGDKVTFENLLQGDQRQKAETALREAIARAELQIAENQPLRLRAQIVTGPTRTETYQLTRAGSTQEQVRLTEKRYEVELSYNDVPIWSHVSLLQSANAPSFVRGEGESIQQIIDQQNQQRLASFGFGALLPRYVVHAQFAGPFGISTIDQNGVRQVPLPKSVPSR
jgi:HEAT repeat protein